MASGRDIQITKQIGEYMACLELCKRGFIATTFTRNIPDFDIIAVNNENKAILVQVKTIKSGSCQLKAEDYLEIDFSSLPKQKVLGKKIYQQEIIYVFIKLDSKYNGNFYILKLRELQDIIFKKYCNYLKKNKLIRPVNNKSTHTDVTEAELIIFKDNWNIFNNIF